MPEDPHSHFKKNSRSFSLAARFLTRETRNSVARLYRFCRYVDDLADASDRGEAEKLDDLAAGLELRRAPHADPVLADFLDLAHEEALPLTAAQELVAATRADCGPRTLPSEPALVQFAYGVAGTVGRLMQPLLGATDPNAEPFAIDLGIALQLTNVARDVAEDAARGRFYLPANWVSPETIKKALHGDDPTATEAVDAAVKRLIELAELYYVSATEGHWFIPPRNRRAIFFALVVYRGIGWALLEKGRGAWRERTVLSLPAKLALGLKAYPRYRALERGQWATSEPPTHSKALHAALSIPSL